MTHKPLCEGCGKRAPLTLHQPNGRHGAAVYVKRAKDHTLCRQCRRSLMDSTRMERFQPTPQERILR